MTTTSIRLVLAATLVASVATAEVGRVGGEFQVNTFTTGIQGTPAIAADAGNRFVIVWQSGAYYGLNQDGSEAGVIAQRFDANGVRAGSEVIVNSFTLGPQLRPTVAATPGGDFVIAWQSGNPSYYYGAHPDGSATGVFLQRFDVAGVRQGTETRANSTTRGRQDDPAVARDAAGGFVVVWQSGGYRFTGDGSSTGIFGQRFDAVGNPVGPEFQVNTYTTGPQRNPTVASDPLGNFVVTWEDGYYGIGQDGSGPGVFARRYDATGTALGGEFQVNSYTTGQQFAPSVASDALGNFVVVWQSGAYSSTGQDGSGGGIFAQRYDAAGVPIAGEFQVNTYTTSIQATPSVATDGDGNFVVAWSQGYYADAITGQHFTAAGVPVGLEFQVSTYTSATPLIPRVAATPGGNFIVTWQGGFNQDGSNRGVFAQRFRTTAFTAPDLIAGNRLVLRDNADPRRKSLSVRADDPGIDLGAGQGTIDDPLLSGGSLRVRGGGFDDTYVLPVANWSAVGRGQSAGYQYRDSALLAGPVKALRVRRGRFKVVGRGAQLGHSLPMNPTPVTVVLQLGDRGQRFCAQYGGTTEYKPDVVYRGRRAPAPPACPQ